MTEVPPVDCRSLFFSRGSADSRSLNSTFNLESSYMSLQCGNPVRHKYDQTFWNGVLGVLWGNESFIGSNLGSNLTDPTGKNKIAGSF